MKKFKNLMVLFRGHIRTWEYISKPTLDFYDSLADNVDYYLVTWQTPFLEIEKVNESFVGRNLIKSIQIFPIIRSGLCHGFKGPGYQANRLLPYKRLREKQIGKYDAVIDTRFDIMASQFYEVVYNNGFGKSMQYIEITEIEPNTLYTDMINVSIEQEPGLTIPRPNDHWFMMSSDMYTAFTERYIRDEKYSSHEEFYFLCQDEGWDLKTIPWIRTMIVRPNIMDVIPNPYDYFDMETQGILKKGLYDYNQDWMDMSVQERIELCKSKRIDPADYEFQNSLISDDIVS